MTDYEDSLFTNLPRRRLAGDERGADAFNRGFREVRGMYQPEGPLPLRPRPSGKGGPSINQGTKPVAHSVWSAADAAANGMTLSNGGLTVNVTAAALHNAWQILRGSISQTSGKVYVEFSTSTGQTITFHLGLASAGVNINSYLGDSNYSAGINPIGGAVFESAGFSVNIPNQTGAAANDVFAFALDFTTGNFWMAYNNAWEGGGSPSLGTDAFGVFTIGTTGPLFPAMAFSTSGSNAVWTLQPTAASQKYAPPAGFAPWG